MKERLKEAMRFYVLATKLKYKIRSGWDEEHWKINKDRLESVAEHIYGTCILAIALYSEFELDVDLGRVIKMLVIHELGEVKVGDITPFDNITPEEKREREIQAVKEIIGDLLMKDELNALWLEFEMKTSKEAILAYHCDKFDADAQSKIYQDMGCHNPLDQQQNNKVFGSAKVQKMVQNGAKEAYDIWYAYDRSLYEDDENFLALFDYLRKINTQTEFSCEN